MLIRESELFPKIDVLTRLNEAVYLTQEEADIHPITIPVREMSRLGEGVTMVRFADVESLAENHGISYTDALYSIAESNGVDINKMTVAVDEATVIADPNIIQEMNNYVIIPVSDDAIYNIIESVVEWANNENNLQLIDEAVDSILNEFGNYGKFNLGVAALGAGLKAYNNHKKNVEVDKAYNRMAALNVDKDTLEHVWKNDPRSKYKGYNNISDIMIYGGLSGALTDINYNKLYNDFKDRPKNQIAKMIARLRKVYAKVMEKMKDQKIKEIGTTKGNLKMLAAHILETIDKLMRRLQQGANKLG